MIIRKHFITLIALLVLSSIASGQTFIVNSILDNPDVNSIDGLCDTGNMVGVDAECTLRAVIQEANLTASSTINFNITGCPNDVSSITVDRINNALRGNGFLIT